MASEFISDYYAKIKYLDDNQRDTILVSSIREFKDEPEKAIDTFSKKNVYSVLWMDKNDQPLQLGIQVSAIECKSISILIQFI